MKKILITFIIAVLSSVQSFSQTGSVLPEEPKLVTVKGNNVELTEEGLNAALEKKAELDQCERERLEQEKNRKKDAALIQSQKSTIKQQAKAINLHQQYVAQSKKTQADTDKLNEDLKSQLNRSNMKARAIGGTLGVALIVVTTFLIIK